MAMGERGRSSAILLKYPMIEGGALAPRSTDLFRLILRLPDETGKGLPVKCDESD